MINFYRLYLHHIGKFPSLSPAEEKKLWQRVKKGDKRAKKKLTVSYLKMVVPIAKKYERSGLDILDLIEEGNIGLIHAIDKYDVRKKVRFSTYSSYWIEQAIRRAVDEQKRTIRIPPHVWNKLKKWFASWEKLQFKYGRNPTIAEMARKMKMNAREIKQMLDIIDVSRSHTSFDALLDEEGTAHIGDFLSDKSEDIEESVRSLAMSDQLDSALGVLPPREKKLIILRAGLYGNKTHTLEQIALKMKISKERVRQLLERSLRCVRAAMDRMKYQK